jgi:hypothetical protein
MLDSVQRINRQRQRRRAALTWRAASFVLDTFRPIAMPNLPGWLGRMPNHVANFRAERYHGEWFDHDLHPGFEMTMTEDRIFRITGNEQDFQVWT